MAKAPQGRFLAIAVSYGVIASGLVFALSYFEGTLFHPKTSVFGDIRAVQYPYVDNISTIVDFAILNPIAVFYVLCAQRGYRTARTHFGGSTGLPLFQKLWLSVASTVVGFSAMWFYFSNFIGGDFYTAAFAPSENSGAQVSLTGWAIFFFTAGWMSFMTFAIFSFGNYVLFVLRLNESDFDFRLPPQMSTGIQAAIHPCIMALYALTVIFVMIMIFLFRDFVQFEIDESRRVWLLVPYILAFFVALLPFVHLHRIMKQQRSRIVEYGNNSVQPLIDVDDKSANTNDLENHSRFIDGIEKLQKLQLFYQSIPIWPTDGRTILIPNIGAFFSISTMLYKIVSSAISPG